MALDSVPEKLSPCERLMQFFTEAPNPLPVGSPSANDSYDNTEEATKDIFYQTVDFLLVTLPHNEELTLAIRYLQVAQMYALAAIAAKE